MESPNIAILPQGNASDTQNPSEGNDYALYEEDLKDFGKTRIKLNRLVLDWAKEEDITEKRRRTRDVDVNVESLRRDNVLSEDETIIPVRVIDTNIQREQPPYINYLKNSRRIAIFRCTDNPTLNTDNLEQAFTQAMTYNSWETAHFKVLDGAQTHGWDSCEVVFDDTKPGNCGIEHVGHDKLFFPRSNLDIQQSPYIVRAYDVTLSILEKYVDEFGFNKEQVDLICKATKDGKKEAETIRIYKFLFKIDSVVNVAWFNLQYGTSDWLRMPAPLKLGIAKQDDLGNWADVPITMYPVFPLYYRETEKPRVIDHKGRVFLDEHKQECATAIQSAYVNGLNRALEIKASPKQDDGTGNSVKEIENKSIGGCHVFDKPLDFFYFPTPAPDALKALQYLDVANSNETSQPNFAVTNREDSRKTAKEIEASQQQASLLNSVQLTLFSTYVRSVYSFAWLIVQSQALQNKIKFLLIPEQVPKINPVTNSPITDPQTGQPITDTKWINDSATLKHNYELRAAGDVDVVQRQELVQQMMQDWPVISQTPLKDAFLSDLIKLKYPADGERYAQILGQAPQMQSLIGMIGQLHTIMEAFIKQDPALISNLPAAQQQQLNQMMQQAQQIAPPPQQSNAQPK